jgi:hypothetical protein
MDEKEIIALGHEADTFMTSRLGAYVMARADMEIEAALDKLSTIDPTDVEGIRRNQNVVKVYMSFKQWISDAGLAGDVAYSDYLSSEE